MFKLGQNDLSNWFELGQNDLSSSLHLNWMLKWRLSNYEWMTTLFRDHWKKVFLITTLMTMKTSHFSFSRRIIPIKHFPNVSSVSETFPFIRYIHMCGSRQLLIVKSNLKRGKKNHPKPQPYPIPPGGKRWTQGSLWHQATRMPWGRA